MLPEADRDADAEADRDADAEAVPEAVPDSDAEAVPDHRCAAAEAVPEADPRCRHRSPMRRHPPRHHDAWTLTYGGLYLGGP